MLRKTLSLTWEEKINNIELYRELPSLSSELRQRRLRFAGHCWRREDELCSQLLLWQPTHGKRRLGALSQIFIDLLEDDTGIQKEELQQLMGDRERWRSYVGDIRGLRPRQK